MTAETTSTTPNAKPDAASMRPRSDERGNGSRTGRSELQSGRMKEGRNATRFNEAAFG